MTVDGTFVRKCQAGNKNSCADHELHPQCRVFLSTSLVDVDVPFAVNQSINQSINRVHALKVRRILVRMPHSVARVIALLAVVEPHPWPLLPPCPRLHASPTS